MQDLFTSRSTGTPLDYHTWNAQYGISDWFGIAVGEGADLTEKASKGLLTAVDPANRVPFPAELDDLIRLHFLCLNRRVTTVLEFGVGKSTQVFARALAHNEREHGAYVQQHLRRAHPFQLFAVDNFPDWVEACRAALPPAEAGRVHFTVTEVEMTTFNDRICTAYRSLPNVCPDLIYIDGPSQFGVVGDVRGITTATTDRLPMAADVLMLEPFLLPGTLILLDGRTANARFLKNNFQREWSYREFPDLELHAFELTEAPLGRINRAQLDYCLGY
ncbi:class I SAM-dependent methyltransferase [Neolewinella lacunae]|uniref:Uncharacterized protein n=1 Tax=Neolewinella lacunae TaxID=1517758 RepID=A0A923PHC9_9BACT|nr:class I SAM-dependent methyltransferase [Neolewinella lacunae]MBC6994148.1 hypothetical protein [Neolewinella lacunae]MDN3636703.1 class I SAM-dependent methyltransferase [Neolewinella lacunae]